MAVFLCFDFLSVGKGILIPQSGHQCCPLPMGSRVLKLFVFLWAGPGIMNKILLASISNLNSISEVFLFMLHIFSVLHSGDSGL